MPPGVASEKYFFVGRARKLHLEIFWGQVQAREGGGLAETTFVALLRFARFKRFEGMTN